MRHLEQLIRFARAEMEIGSIGEMCLMRVETVSALICELEGHREKYPMVRGVRLQTQAEDT